MITLVAAKSKNGVIGKGSGLPWHIPAELKFFKRETLGSAVVMGRKSWDSFPFKPLKDRLNIVLSRANFLDVPDGVETCGTPQEALIIARKLGFTRISIIGGEQIFREYVDIADRIILTEVDMEVDDGDAFFPEIDTSDWNIIESGTITDEPHKCVWLEYMRTKTIQENA